MHGMMLLKPLPHRMALLQAKATLFFIYASSAIIAYFMVYVDDFLLTGNDAEFLHNFIQSLSKTFSVKNMRTM